MALLATSRFTPATQSAGLKGTVRPYDLRHSFVSLLLTEGATVVEVARQAGHSPAMTLSTYAHLFEELDGADRHSAEDKIRRAREAARTSRTRFVPANPIAAPSAKGETPAKARKADARIRTADPFITSEVLYQLSYVGTSSKL